MRLIRRALNGAVAGLVATLPMTGAMMLLARDSRFDDRSPLAPAQILRRLRLKWGLHRETRDAQTPAALAAHFAYGAALGFVYSLLVGGRRAPKLTGVGFALAAWSISYLGWLPAAGLFRRATEDDRSRQRRIIAAHVIWGESLQLTHLLLQKNHKRHDGEA